MPTQEQMYYAAERKAADRDIAFLDLSAIPQIL